MSYLSPKLIVGNWKMHGLSHDLEEIKEIYRGLSASFSWDNRCVLCLPATLIFRAFEFLQPLVEAQPKKNFSLGGQDCHFSEKGSYTGDISASMLADAKAEYVILGHSERRTIYKETSEKICAKAIAAWQEKLVPIICIGETEEEREAGQTFAILKEQLLHSLPFEDFEINREYQPFVIAYEPIWAIGTGKIANETEICEVHTYLYEILETYFGDKAKSIPLLYGGSVQKHNAAKILKTEHVHGVLVGGASLKAKDFLPICDNA